MTEQDLIKQILVNDSAAQVYNTGDFINTLSDLITIRQENKYSYNDRIFHPMYITLIGVSSTHNIPFAAPLSEGVILLQYKKYNFYFNYLFKIKGIPLSGSCEISAPIKEKYCNAPLFFIDNRIDISLW